MAELKEQISSLLALDPIQRLALFAAFDQNSKLAVCRELFQLGELSSNRRLFARLAPAQIADLFHDLDPEIGEELRDLLGEGQRQEVMLTQLGRGHHNDLQAMLRQACVNETVALLQESSQDCRRQIFRLLQNPSQVDVLVNLHANNQDDEIRRLIDLLAPADVADLLEKLDQEDRDPLLNSLERTLQAEILAELKTGIALDLIRKFPLERLMALLELMTVDDVARLVRALRKDERSAFLTSMPAELRDSVTILLSYEKGTAGRLMTRELCSLPKTASVAEACSVLEELKEAGDPIFYVFVTDPADQSLVGAVPIVRLINAPPEVVLETLCEAELIVATPHEDQEEIARRFRRYDLWVMPVVDEKQRLLGRITVDDIMEVMQEEAEEDLMHLVGAADPGDGEETITKMLHQRLPWLLMALVVGLLNSVLLHTMMQVTLIPAVAIFAPTILILGCSVGLQSSMACLRRIVRGEKLTSQLVDILWNEARSGAVLGLVCGVGAGVMVYAVLLLSSADTGRFSPLALGLVVALALLATMTFAGALGSLAPVVMQRLGGDPTLASGPLATLANQVFSLLFYFGACVLLLRVLGRVALPGLL